jgi:hypothetical protein
MQMETKSELMLNSSWIGGQLEQGLQYQKVGPSFIQELDISQALGWGAAAAGARREEPTAAARAQTEGHPATGVGRQRGSPWRSGHIGVGRDGRGRRHGGGEILLGFGIFFYFVSQSGSGPMKI